MNEEEIARTIGEYKVISKSPFIAEYRLGPLRIRVLISVTTSPIEAAELAERIVASGRADHALIVVRGKTASYTAMYPHVTVIHESTLYASHTSAEAIPGMIRVEKPVKCFEPICNEKPRTEKTVIDFLLPVYIASFRSTTRKYLAIETVTGLLVFDAVKGQLLNQTDKGLEVIPGYNIGYEEGLVLDTLRRPLTLEALKAKILIDPTVPLKKLLSKKFVKKLKKGRHIFYKSVVPGPRSLAKNNIWRHLRTTVYNPSTTYTLKPRVTETDIVEKVSRMIGGKIDVNVKMLYYPLYIVLDDKIKVFDRVRCKWLKGISDLITSRA